MTTTILAVDDDPKFRAVLRGLLEQEPDFELIAEAENGEDAVLAMHSLHPDLVLMDVTMPGVNGLEATRRIKSDNPETKVVVITVHPGSEYERAAFATGADAFVTKKNLAAQLLPTIRHILGSSLNSTTEGIRRFVSVVLVDDDVDFLNSTAAYLQAQPVIRVSACAHGGANGIAEACVLRPDVVIVDLEMADLPALQVVDILRRRFPRMGIIALSSLDAEGFGTGVLAVGANTVVAKSGLKTDLIPAILALAEGRPTDKSVLRN